MGTRTRYTKNYIAFTNWVRELGEAKQARLRMTVDIGAQTISVMFSWTPEVPCRAEFLHEYFCTASVM